MIKKVFVPALFFVFVIQGCATLSKSECREADWEIIGLEDASNGHPLNYISEHRKSCAEHGIKPNLDQYKIGHANGVVLYCTPRKAFDLGSNGRNHQDICPAELRDAFLAAYDDGHEVYTARNALRKADDQIKAANLDLDTLKESITTLETELVSSNGTAEQRQNWLSELKRLQNEKAQLQVDIHDLEHEVTDRQDEYNYLKSQFNY